MMKQASSTCAQSKRFVLKVTQLVSLELVNLSRIDLNEELDEPDHWSLNSLCHLINMGMIEETQNWQCVIEKVKVTIAHCFYIDNTYTI